MCFSGQYTCALFLVITAPSCNQCNSGQSMWSILHNNRKIIFSELTIYHLVITSPYLLISHSNIKTICLISCRSPLCCQSMDSTRPLNVSCGIWHQDISKTSFRSYKLQREASMDQICWSSTSHRCSIGNLETKATYSTLFHVPQIIP